jgi:hypothetical protein
MTAALLTHCEGDASLWIMGTQISVVMGAAHAFLRRVGCQKAVQTGAGTSRRLCITRPPEALRHPTWCADGPPILRQGQRSLHRKIRESRSAAQLAENQQMDEVVIKSYSLIDIISYAILCRTGGRGLGLVPARDGRTAAEIQAAGAEFSDMKFRSLMAPWRGASGPPRTGPPHRMRGCRMVPCGSDGKCRAVRSSRAAGSPNVDHP